MLDIINFVAGDHSSIFGGDKTSLLVKTDEWFAQYGVINKYVIDRAISYLISGNFGIKDVEFQIYNDLQRVSCKVYLSFFSYYFRRKNKINKIKFFLRELFNSYDVDLEIIKYRG